MATQITRDEIKFSKFIQRLQLRFSQMFLSALEKQLILKKIIAPEEWEFIKGKIAFQFSKDNVFSELKDTELTKNRLNTLQMVQPFVGSYFSSEWVNRHVLRRTDQDIKEIATQINNEIKAGIIPNPAEQQQETSK